MIAKEQERKAIARIKEIVEEKNEKILSCNISRCNGTNYC